MESLSVEAIRQVCTDGPGHFLGHEQTLDLMQKDYVYPTVGDRTSPKEWVEQGSTDVIDKACKSTRQILETHFPDHIDGAMDARLRERFPILLPRENMRPRS